MESASAPNTIDKAIDVLFHLHGAAAPQGVTAIGRALDIPKSSTHRLLRALARRGLVERDARGQYQAGVALIALGLGVLEREPVVVAARPVLEAQAGRLGETFFLVAARGGRLVVLDKAEGTGFLRAAPRVGSSVPIHATAVGKLHLAFAPESVALDEKPFERFTAATPADHAALEREVRHARTRGWAANRDEWIAGLSVIAAPVRAGGRMHASVALAASTPRVDELGLEALAERVIETASEIAARLELGGSQ